MAHNVDGLGSEQVLGGKVDQIKAERFDDRGKAVKNADWRGIFCYGILREDGG
jgi:hypothetical protein